MPPPDTANAAGRLLGIASRRASRAPMDEHERAMLTVAGGVAGDRRGRPGTRQLTILSREAWEAACRQAGAALPWTARRANLLVEGIDLEQTAGRVLEIGSARVRITVECDPCRVMNGQHAGLEEALAVRWRGGACARVEHGGEITCGDAVAWADERVA